ncbi:hypothetical protein KIAC18_001941 [Sporomusa sphaeroides]|uniref:polysialyltransferase family glycosyltransferase n=1 Tax=Sporomusa sphaeroides TaxID=47679 RepID=UPI003DA0D294
MQNLYIVYSPFHLLTAYILANRPGETGDNHLIVLHANCDKWLQSNVLRKMFEDDCTWKKVNVFRNWLNRKTSFRDIKPQIELLRGQVSSLGPVNEIYIGVDNDIKSQLLVEICGKTSFRRFDEGIGSYYAPEKRTWISKQWHLLRVGLLRWQAGVKSDMQYNVSNIGSNKAVTYDYLYKPELLMRPSPNPVGIDRALVRQVIARVTQDVPLYRELEEQDALLFLNSPFVELGMAKLEEEHKILLALANVAREKGIRFVYKPHHLENADKIAFYRNNLPETVLFECVDPVEILYNSHKRLKYVVSYLSSGLLHADIFANQDIKAISLVKLYGNNSDENYTEIMRRANVFIPNTIDQLQDFIKLDSKGAITHV